MRILGSMLFLVLGISGVFNLSLFDSIDNYYEQFAIVPTFINAAPEAVISVRYDNNIVVNTGTEVPAFVTHLPPYIYYEAELNDLYTLIFVDLDSPSVLAPFESPYLHLLVVNIPGANITSGDFLSSYIPPIPIPGSGYHRYLFLVYRQDSSIDVTAPELLAIRRDYRNFSLRYFSSKYGLGNPIAGNFFTSSLIVCGGQQLNTRKRCTV